MHELILGGTRSGKSRLAEQRARASNRRVLTIATAQALDEEMAARIAKHRADRPADWPVIEEPLALADALKEACAADTCVIVDCLTLWLSNLLLQDNPQRLQQEVDALLAGISTLPGQVLLVSNETGLGVIPMGQLSRDFVDQAGWLHQALAERCQRVTFCVAGLTMTLKPSKDHP